MDSMYIPGDTQSVSWTEAFHIYISLQQFRGFCPGFARLFHSLCAQPILPAIRVVQGTVSDLWKMVGIAMDHMSPQCTVVTHNALQISYIPFYL